MDQFSKERTAYPVAQLACIVNQLHRLALIMPEAKLDKTFFFFILLAGSC